MTKADPSTALPGHRPSMGTGIRTMLLVFTAVMTLAALAYWATALALGGAQAATARIAPTLMVLFTIAHLPATAAAVLLWRAGTFRGRATLRLGLLGAATYFSAACIIAVFGNALAASVLGLIAR